LVSIFQASAVTRAKGRFKARVCKSIIEDRDWRARLELLSRIYPEEFARTADRPLPQEPQSKEPLLKFVLNTGGKTLEELLDFPARCLKCSTCGEPLQHDHANGSTSGRDDETRYNPVTGKVEPIEDDGAES